MASVTDTIELAVRLAADSNNQKLMNDLAVMRENIRELRLTLMQVCKNTEGWDKRPELIARVKRALHATR